MCTICVEACDASRPHHTLACGHTFRVDCVMHWFRFENSSCPNCRSEEESHFWLPMSASQRVGLLRRRKNSLPRRLQRRLEKLVEYRELGTRLRRERSELKKTHANVFRTHSALSARIRSLEEKHACLLDCLSNQASDHVPFLLPLDDASEQEEDFV